MALLFQSSYRHNAASENFSLLSYVMQLKNSEMQCVKASVQMQNVILRWFGLITVDVHHYTFITALITLLVLLRTYEDANNLLSCYKMTVLVASF